MGLVCCVFNLNKCSFAEKCKALLCFWNCVSVCISIYCVCVCQNESFCFQYIDTVYQTDRLRYIFYFIRRKWETDEKKTLKTVNLTKLLKSIIYHAIFNTHSKFDEMVYIFRRNKIKKMAANIDTNNLERARIR